MAPVRVFKPASWRTLRAEDRRVALDRRWPGEALQAPIFTGSAGEAA